jgi:hypothetical protein
MRKPPLRGSLLRANLQINQFKRAQDGICAYITDGKIIMIPFGLNGFTAAMNQIGA